MRHSQVGIVLILLQALVWIAVVLNNWILSSMLWLNCLLAINLFLFWIEPYLSVLWAVIQWRWAKEAQGQVWIPQDWQDLDRGPSIQQLLRAMIEDYPTFSVDEHYWCKVSSRDLDILVNLLDVPCYQLPRFTRLELISGILGKKKGTHLCLIHERHDRLVRFAWSWNSRELEVSAAALILAANRLPKR